MSTPLISDIHELKDVLQFTLSNINYSVANAIRRTILANIPCFVFKTTPYSESMCDIITNTSKFNNEIIGRWSYSSFFNFQTQFAKGYRFGNDSNGNPIRTEKSRFFSPATIQLGVGLYWKKSKDLWVNVAPMTGKLILVNRKFTKNLNENQTYFGVKKGGNSRFELGASVRSFYKKEIFQNITMENRLSLYSDYLDRPQNIDFDCTFNFVMKVNQFVSTNLIFQFVYDDNEIKRVQIREVLGVGLNIDLSKIRI